MKKSEEQTRKEHGERIAARQRENRQWHPDELDYYGDHCGFGRGIMCNDYDLSCSGNCIFSKSK